MGGAGDGLSGVEAGTEATMDSTKLERKPVVDRYTFGVSCFG